MRIGIIGPTIEEIKLFQSRMETEYTEKPLGLRTHVGKCQGVDVVAMECGIGKVNGALATQYLIDIYKITHFIVCGSCGAMKTGMKIGEVILGEKIYHHDVIASLLQKRPPYLKEDYFSGDEEMMEKLLNLQLPDVSPGIIVTGEVFIDQEGRKEIIEKFNPDVVDMETAAMAQVCHINKIPFLAIRSITDTPEASGLDEFAKNLETAVQKATYVLEAYLKEIGK